MSLNLSNLYEKNGFIEFENIFEKNTIDKWNKILDNSSQFICVDDVCLGRY